MLSDPEDALSGQDHRIAGRVIALHAVDLGSSPGIPYGSSSLPGVTLEYCLGHVLGKVA